MELRVKHKNGSFSYFKHHAVQFFQRYGKRRWLQELNKSHVWIEFREYLMDKNRMRNEGILTCDFCKEQIILINNSYRNCLIMHIDDHTTPYELLNPNKNLLLHEKCYKKLQYEKKRFQEGKDWK